MRRRPSASPFGKNVEKMVKFWNFQKCHIFHLKSIQIDILIVFSTRKSCRLMFQMLSDMWKLQFLEIFFQKLKFWKILKILFPVRKTHSWSSFQCKNRFFRRSCALEINKWCEALSPDGQNREIWDPGIKLWRPLILASVLNFRKILLLKFWIVQRPKIRVQCELHRNGINRSGTYSSSSEHWRPRVQIYDQNLSKFWKFQKFHIFDFKSIQIDIFIVSSTGCGGGAGASRISNACCANKSR